MANFLYTPDLKADALFRAGEPTDGTSDYDSKVLEYLNRAYQAIWMGGSEIAPDINEDWLWLRKSTPGVLTLETAYKTGTISVTNNSASVTFSATITDSKVDWFIQVTGRDDVFRVSAHTGGSASATLDSVYTGVTNATASFTLYKVEYSIASDVLSLIAPLRAYQNREIEIYGMDTAQMDGQYPLVDLQSGVPDRFTFVGENKIRFNRYGSEIAGELIRVDYDYLAKPSDLTGGASEEPLIPFQYRRVLADVATYWLMLDKNELVRAKASIDGARSLLLSMSIENRRRLGVTTKNMGKIIPRGREKYYRGPLRTTSGLIIG